MMFFFKKKGEFKVFDYSIKSPSKEQDSNKTIKPWIDLPSISWINSSKKNLYPLVNVALTGKFAFANVSIKELLNFGIKFKFLCQKSSTLVVAVEDAIF